MPAVIGALLSAAFWGAIGTILANVGVWAFQAFMVVMFTSVNFIAMDGVLDVISDRITDYITSQVSNTGNSDLNIATLIVLEFIEAVGVKEYINLILSAHITAITISIGKSMITQGGKIRKRKVGLFPTK